MESSDEAIRRNENFDCITINYDLGQKIKNSLSIISNFDKTGTITINQINHIGDTLANLQAPEEYGLNFFLIRLIAASPHNEIGCTAFLVLSNNFKDSNVKLKSFNPKALANDICFSVILQFLSVDVSDQLLRISVLIIINILESVSNRDFISLENYNILFTYILSGKYKSNEIFSTIILEIEKIHPQFHPVIFTILSNYMRDRNIISNINLYPALFGIMRLVLAKIEVPQELLTSSSQFFIESIDETMISCILYIMTRLNDPPLFAFKKILDIIQNYDSDISLLAIRIMALFCTKWTDSQKEILVNYLMSSYQNFNYKSSNYAMYILLKLMRPLPTDPLFFSVLINGIESCNYQPLSLASAQLIIYKWVEIGLDEEKMNLIHDFQSIIEHLIYSEDEDVANMCYNFLYIIESITSKNEN